MKFLIDKKGNIRSAASLLIGVVGAVLVFGPLYFKLHPWIVVFGLVLGMVLMGFSAYATKSATLDLRAFTNDPIGWRKAKKSYEQDSTPSSDDSEKR